ncbi:MAG: dihydrodipicolinate synthase family protein [Desulfovibrionales bacterium]|nr:dihydrodipicolinate synthase family protein [Desulfovibrionales bacterium]
MRRIKGVMVVVPTPLTANEDADLEGIERLIDFLAGHGLALFALGSAGEGMNLSFATRVAVARKMAEVNDGRVPLLVGGGSFSVRDSLEFIGAVADCRIDGIHVIPYDKKISGEAVELLYRGIADRSPLPIWLYQNTTRTSGIPIEVVKSLKSHPNIHGVKLAGFDLRVNQGFMALNSPDFQVFGSADCQMFSFLCHGLEASSSSTAACFPELFKELYVSIQSDSLSRARAKNDEIMSFLKRLPKGAYWHNGESAAEVKYLLSLRGICKEYVAKPFRGQTDEEKRLSEAVYRDYEHYLKTGKLCLA